MRRSRLAHLSTDELIAELHVRAAFVERLQRQRAELIRRIAELDREIEAAAPGGPGGGVRRRRNTPSLTDALAVALKGKEMDITEAAEAALQAGYTTKATNMYGLVAQRLIDPKRFRRVRRGVYTAV